jgi:hypothetical protein
MMDLAISMPSNLEWLTQKTRLAGNMLSDRATFQYEVINLNSDHNILCKMSAGKNKTKLCLPIFSACQ